MVVTTWPFEQPILVATSYPAEALVLRAAIERIGVPVVLVDDAVTAMHALCGRPAAFAALVTGDRVGRISGLSLCGLARDTGCAIPALLLTAGDCGSIAARAARLRVGVLWQPVSERRLDQALHELLPRRTCAAPRH